jgi:histidinol-phosphatase (PHP family)
MRLWDYHTHNSRCNHAQGSIIDYVRSAIDKNLIELGVSDHAPGDLLPILPQFEKYKNFSMLLKDFPGYLREIETLKEKFKKKILIRTSTEISFSSLEAFKIQEQALKPFIDKMDYIIGGIHTIHWEGVDSWSFNIPHQSTPILEKYGANKINLEYYNILKEMVKSDFIDIVAHFDNFKYMYRPNEPEYSDEVRQTIFDIMDTIEKTEKVVEINTSGILKGLSNHFPSDFIVKELIQRKIPLTLGSDAHKPEQVGFMFDNFINKAKKWNLTHLYLFNKRELQPVRIT